MLAYMPAPWIRHGPMAAGQSDDLQEWVDNPIFLPWRGYSQR